MNLRLQLHQSQRRLKHNLNLKMEEKMEEKKVIKVFIFVHKIRHSIHLIQVQRMDNAILCTDLSFR